MGIGARANAIRVGARREFNSVVSAVLFGAPAPSPRSEGRCRRSVNHCRIKRTMLPAAPFRAHLIATAAGRAFAMPVPNTAVRTAPDHTRCKTHRRA